MSKTKSKTVKVKKTEQLNQQKLNRIANRFGISPLSVRELQLGFVEEIPRAAADLLIQGGFVKEARDKVRSMQEKVDSMNAAESTVDLTMEDKEPTKTTESNEPNMNIDDTDIENSDNQGSENKEEQS